MHGLRWDRFLCGALLCAWFMGAFALAADAPEELVWLIGLEDHTGAWGRDLVSRQIEATYGVSVTPIYLGAAQKP
ncbi:MAG TPA: hypothetical protein PKE04_22900, partial [Clostridia bacterium]|nr:hypothetical protein [Clostridia bacterium]